MCVECAPSNSSALTRNSHHLRRVEIWSVGWEVGTVFLTESSTTRYLQTTANPPPTDHYYHGTQDHYPFHLHVTNCHLFGLKHKDVRTASRVRAPNCCDAAELLRNERLQAHRSPNDPTHTESLKGRRMRSARRAPADFLGHQLLALVRVRGFATSYVAPLLARLRWRWVTAAPCRRPGHRLSWPW